MAPADWHRGIVNDKRKPSPPGAFCWRAPNKKNASRHPGALIYDGLRGSQKGPVSHTTAPNARKPRRGWTPLMRTNNDSPEKPRRMRTWASL